MVFHGGALEVHRALGPGLLESAYQHCLAHELRRQNVAFASQQPLPIVCKGVHVDAGYRVDIRVGPSPIHRSLITRTGLFSGI